MFKKMMLITCLLIISLMMIGCGKKPEPIKEFTSKIIKIEIKAPTGFFNTVLRTITTEDGHVLCLHGSQYQKFTVGDVISYYSTPETFTKSEGYEVIKE